MSAAILWGWAKALKEPFHVTAALDRRPSGIVVHRSKLRARDRRKQTGIRVTSPARTMLDWAPSLPEAGRARAVNDALLSDYLTHGALADVVAGNPRHPAYALLRPFVEDGREPTRSSLEDDFGTFCARYGLPQPLVNVRVCGFLVDAYFPDYQLIVEIDGWIYHRSRETFESDRDRDATTLANGIATMRTTDRRLDHAPRREADRLNAILSARQPERPT